MFSTKNQNFSSLNFQSWLPRLNRYSKRSHRVSCVGCRKEITTEALTQPLKAGKRTDLKKNLILGAGPIVIGQACEFDYFGTQACNSNPAAIMIDPELADRTYIEPMTLELLEQVIEKERPDALLPTMGGQTALNLVVA
ncbi:hypothetical protein P3X46_010081 [Hevea brasiliensis]|uniref:Carbamoyl phosphate synthase preATP-grasp domain-containing protein n=1 Tax=Hevea brasiliensis TaxID=3981 RepID=A0ABQ9MFM5_HEVBR|nr:hypothetical protein P3X46_010081 [Hevea brasiliensis]